IVQDEEYFRREVAPQIDGDRVRYIGPVGPAERNEVLGWASALLHLISFDEPFGLSMVEAMACGTPVIAYRRGVIPERVKHLTTGFIVDNIDQAVEAVATLGEINRMRTRLHVEENFSEKQMVEKYIKVYEQVLNLEASK